MSLIGHIAVLSALLSTVSAQTGTPSRPPTAKPSTYTPSAAPTIEPGWLMFSIFDANSCEGDAIQITANPLGVCIPSFNNQEEPVASFMIDCHDDSVTWKAYLNGNCHGSAYEYDLPLECSADETMYYDGEETEQAIQVSCHFGDEDDLPLSGDVTYAVAEQYNEEGCDADMIGFNAYINDHCVNVDYDGIGSSFKYEYPDRYAYTEPDCPEDEAAEEEELSEVCEETNGAIFTLAQTNKNNKKQSVKNPVTSLRGKKAAHAEKKTAAAVHEKKPNPMDRFKARMLGAARSKLAAEAAGHASHGKKGQAAHKTAQHHRNKPAAKTSAAKDSIATDHHVTEKKTTASRHNMQRKSAPALKSAKPEKRNVATGRHTAAAANHGAKAHNKATRHHAKKASASAVAVANEHWVEYHSVTQEDYDYILATHKTHVVDTSVVPTEKGRHPAPSAAADKQQHHRTAATPRHRHPAPAHAVTHREPAPKHAPAAAAAAAAAHPHSQQQQFAAPVTERALKDDNETINYFGGSGGSSNNNTTDGGDFNFEFNDWWLDDDNVTYWDFHYEFNYEFNYNYSNNYEFNYYNNGGDDDFYFYFYYFANDYAADNNLNTVEECIEGNIIGYRYYSTPFLIRFFDRVVTIDYWSNEIVTIGYFPDLTGKEGNTYELSGGDWCYDYSSATYVQYSGKVTLSCSFIADHNVNIQSKGYCGYDIFIKGPEYCANNYDVAGDGTCTYDRSYEYAFYSNYQDDDDGLEHKYFYNYFYYGDNRDVDDWKFNQYAYFNNYEFNYYYYYNNYHYNYHFYDYNDGYFYYFQNLLDDDNWSLDDLLPFDDDNFNLDDILPNIDDIVPADFNFDDFIGDFDYYSFYAYNNDHSFYNYFYQYNPLDDEVFGGVPVYNYLYTQWSKYPQSTSTSTHAPSRKPTARPTITPTAAPTTKNENVVFTISQTLSGMSASDYNANKEANDAVFKAALVETLSDYAVTEDDITINSVTDAVRRRKLSSASVHVLSGTVVVDYTIAVNTETSGFVNGNDAVTHITDTLTSAVTGGSFTTALTQAATDQGNTAMVGVTSDEIEVEDTDITSAETSSSEDSSGLSTSAVIGIAVGVGGGGLLIIIIVVAYMLSSRQGSPAATTQPAYSKAQTAEAVAVSGARQPASAEMVVMSKEEAI